MYIYDLLLFGDSSRERAMTLDIAVTSARVARSLIGLERRARLLYTLFTLGAIRRGGMKEPHIAAMPRITSIFEFAASTVTLSHHARSRERERDIER